MSSAAAAAGATMNNNFHSNGKDLEEGNESQMDQSMISEIESSQQMSQMGESVRYQEHVS